MNDCDSQISSNNKLFTLKNGSTKFHYETCRHIKNHSVFEVSEEDTRLKKLKLCFNCAFIKRK